MPPAHRPRPQPYPPTWPVVLIIRGDRTTAVDRESWTDFRPGDDRWRCYLSRHQSAEHRDHSYAEPSRPDRFAEVAARFDAYDGLLPEQRRRRIVGLKPCAHRIDRIGIRRDAQSPPKQIDGAAEETLSPHAFISWMPPQLGRPKIRYTAAAIRPRNTRVLGIEGVNIEVLHAVDPSR